MPNPIKYSGTTELNALKSGDWWIGTNDIALGPTSESDFYVGIEPPSNGYTIYEARPDNLPSIYVAQGDEELIFLTNHISENSYTTIQQCFNYFNDQNNKFVLRRNIEPIVTDGLVLYLDAGLLPSYPRSGTTWNDLSLSGNTGTLINGVSYNNGAMVFDGVDDIVKSNNTINLKNSSFTLSSFYAYDGTSNTSYILGGGIPLRDKGLHFGLRGINGTTATYTIDFFQNSIDTYITVPNNGTFQYFSVTYNYNSNTSVLYLNGSAVLSATMLSAFQNDSFNLEIGSMNLSNSRIWYSSGKLGTAQVYNRALTADEVLQNYNAQKDRYAFITSWETTSSGETITLPLISTGTYDFTVEWGDGNTDTITSYNQSEVTHTYTDAGTYTVKIRGIIQGFQFNNGGDKHKIRSIDNYGPLVITTNAAFYGCTGLTSSAIDSPEISTTSLYSTFRDCTNFNGYINNWDVSNVTSMSYMFFYASSFNQPLNNWDVSSVTSMHQMFRSALSFNQPIGNWDVSNVTDMSVMFYGVTGQQTSFNQPLNDWDVSSVTNMGYMFGFNTSFNQPLNNWDVSSVTNMVSMFGGLSNTRSVFNQDIGSWNVSGVTNMNIMFFWSSAFNNGGSDSIKNWDVSNVTNMGGMFYVAPFNQPIGNWDVSSVTNMVSMFSFTPFNQDISGWDVSNVTNMFQTFRSTSFNQDIGSWNVSGVTNMSRMFDNNRFFNQDIGNWNVSGVTDMYQMFYNADAFDQDISNWDIDQVTDFSDFMTLADGLSTTNYDELLVDWEAQVPQPNLSINFGGSKYTSGSAAATARQSLIDNYNWTITDGGTA